MDADPEFRIGKDWTTQRYTESQLYSGAFYDSGGCETISEWQDRGQYYLFNFPRDASDRSTRVTVNQKFAAGTDVANTRCLLFDISKQACKITISQGRCTDVALEDI